MAKTLLIGDSVFKGIPRTIRIEGHELVDKTQIRADINAISKQYSDFVFEYRELPRVVIFNGGGNDILSNTDKDCIARNEICNQLLDKTLASVYRLLDQMVVDSVEKVIYLGLHYLGKDYAALNPTIDIAMEQISVVCDAAPIDCVFLDPRSFLHAGGKDLFFDGLHLNKSGANIVAELLLEEL